MRRRRGRIRLVRIGDLADALPRRQGPAKLQHPPLGPVHFTLRQQKTDLLTNETLSDNVRLLKKVLLVRILCALLCNV